MTMEEPLSAMLQIKTWSCEKAAFERAASRLGLSLSTYVRIAMREHSAAVLPRFGARAGFAMMSAGNEPLTAVAVSFGGARQQLPPVTVRADQPKAVNVPGVAHQFPVAVMLDGGLLIVPTPPAIEKPPLIWLPW